MNRTSLRAKTQSTTAAPMEEAPLEEGQSRLSGIIYPTLTHTLCL